MTFMPPSREPLPSWSSDRISIFGFLASTSLQPLTRSITADDLRPVLDDHLAALVAQLVDDVLAGDLAGLDIVGLHLASAPAAATSTATTTIPAACARLTAGAIALASAALSRIRSTPEAMKLSIWVNCLFRS